MRTSGLPLSNIFLDLGLRLIVGVVFLVAGVAKLPMHLEWAEVIMADEILPSSLVNPYLAALPIVEIIIGSCLIIGLFIRFFSVISLLVIITFIIGNSIALMLDVSEWSGFFGERVPITHQWALVIDALLIVGVSLIFSRRRRFVAMDSMLSRLPVFNFMHL